MVNECSGLRQRLDLGAVYALCFENEKKFPSERRHMDFRVLTWRARPPIFVLIHCSEKGFKIAMKSLLFQSARREAPCFFHA